MKTKVSSVVLVVMFASLSACASKPVEPARPLDTSTERAPAVNSESAPSTLDAREHLLAQLTEAERAPVVVSDAATIEARRDAFQPPPDGECLTEQITFWTRTHSSREVWSFDDARRVTRYTNVARDRGELASVKIVSAEYVGETERVARRVTLTAEQPTIVSEVIASTVYTDGGRQETTDRVDKNIVTGEDVAIPRSLSVMTLDAKERPLSESIRAEGAPDIARAWSYDAKGHELSFLETHGGEDFERRSASYDESGRLVRSHEAVGMRYPSITDTEITYEPSGAYKKIVSFYQAHAGMVAPSKTEYLSDEQGHETCARSLGESECSRRWSYDAAGHLVRFEDDIEGEGTAVTEFSRTSTGESIASITRSGGDVVWAMEFVWKCD